MGRLALFLLTACLSVTAMAADVIKGERKETFGDVTVHYNTFNSTFLTPDIAKAAGLTRSKNQGVINVSVLKDGKPLTAEVSGIGQRPDQPKRTVEVQTDHRTRRDLLHRPVPGRSAGNPHLRHQGAERR